MTLEIRTNHHWRSPCYGFELTPAERAEFDYLDWYRDVGEVVLGGEAWTHEFARYRGVVYDLSEFETTSGLVCTDDKFADWHGYRSDSYFSGVLLRWSEDFEEIILATYMS